MERSPRIQKSVILLAVCLLAGLLMSCAGEVDSRPRVWIDSPRGGVTVPDGVPVSVLAHAYAREGLAEIVLYVNGTAYQRATPAVAGADFSEFTFAWTPTGPGDYSLQAWAYDLGGETGDPATIVLHVGGDIVATPPDVPTLVATLVPTTPPTLVPTLVPTTPPTLVPSPTNPPPRPTDTPPPPPADTSPPPVPSPAVPTNGLVVSCRSSQTLAWLPVQDPSGIDGYYVQLEREVTAGNWQDVNSWGPVSGKQVDASVDCGIKYRWRVRARDGAGNTSSWSAWSEFALDLT